MDNDRFDVIVVGGGPGGYVCAIRLAQLGLKVVCLEAEDLGGVCLNWGCIPSKLLVETAHLWASALQARAVGLRYSSLELDLAQFQAHKQAMLQKLRSGIRALLKGNGVTLIQGRGELVDARTVRVTGAGDTARLLPAERAIVLATGSRAAGLRALPFDGQSIISAREALSLRQLPRRLLVVGGGAIGLELGTALQALGSELVVVELLPALLSGLDPECVEVVRRRLSKRGARILTSSRVTGGERLSDGTLAVRLETPAGLTTVECDLVLVAVGMQPRSDGLGLEALGVALDDRGFVRTDEQCRSTVPGVYAIGDLAGPPMLAHKASRQGEVCAEMIAGRAAAPDWTALPVVVFTDPEIASVGLGEKEARDRGYQVKVGRFPFAALGRAMTVGETEGFVKVVSDVERGRLLGCQIVGPAASDLISEATLALELGAQVEDLAATIHPHPTLAEAVMEASAAALGRAINILNR